VIPKVYLALREVFRDHLGEEDITVQLVAVECEQYVLWFTKPQLAAYVEQVTDTEKTFARVWNSYLWAESFDHEVFFVRREQHHLVVMFLPELDRYKYEWGPLRDAILEVLKEE
jgi:hypothetical protein